jgi:RHS repeat-associated protein
LKDVTITLGGATLTPLGTTDDAGNFFVTGVPTGTQTILIDGSTANQPGIEYSTIPVTVNIQAGVVNSLEFMPYITAHPTVELIPITPSQDTVLTHPEIPGFEMTIPAGVDIIGWDGQANTEVGVIEVPIDRTPLPPLPANVNSRVVYLFSFGKVGGGLPTGNVPVTTPNVVGGLPGDKVDLYYFDEAPDGTRPNEWVQYGTGTVSSDGTQIIPDINPSTGLPYGVPRFCCGAIFPALETAGTFWGGVIAGFLDSGQKAGEPVDISTGFFSFTKTDMILPGILPLVVDRTYRTNMNNPGPFGIGTSWSFDTFLEPPPNGSPDLLVLVSPENRQDIFSKQPDGTFINTTTPALRGAVVTLNGGNRVLTFKDKQVWTFDPDGRLISQQDRNGNTVTLTRDGQGRVTEITEPTGRELSMIYVGSTLRIDAIYDSIQRKVEYNYDANGRLIEVIDPNGGTTQYTYDTSNRIVTITDARNITFLTNEYDSSGRVIKQTLADGGIFTFDYTTVGDFITSTKVTDPLGNPTTYRFNRDRYPISQTDALGQTTRFERDPNSNLLLSTTDPLGRKTTFAYEAAGNVSSITDPEQNVTQFTYEPAFNRLTSITDALNQTTTFQYDANGNLTKTIDPLLNETTITYNSFGQPETVTDPLLNTTHFEYDTEGNLVATEDPLGNQTARAYDAVSRLIALTDPLGRNTKFDYDGLNRVTQITDAKNQITGFTYDANGNLLTVTDANSNTTTYTYDVQDRLNTRTDPLSRQESYTYDLNGNLKTFTDRKLQVSTFTYDSLDRRTLSQYDDGSTTSFTYDTVGRLTIAEDSTSGRIEFTYDNLDRLTQELTPQGTVEYQYDAIGRRTTMTVNGQTPVTYQYDSNSRLTQVAQGTQVVGLGYDAAGRRTSLSYPNGVNTTYTYDFASRLFEIEHLNVSTQELIERLSYTYDAAGNRISFTRTNGTATLLPEAVQAAYDAANEQIQFNNPTPNLTYDANGNLTSQTDASGTTTYTWDSRNRLVAMSGSGVSANFVYDALGRRVSKTINGTTTEYQFDGNDIVVEIGSGAVAATYLRSLAIDEPFIRQSSSTAEFYHTDALGSVLALTDQAGAIQSTYRYDPFGNTTITGTSSNVFQFSGREADQTGLYFLRARYYSPTLHRFISEDPIGLLGGDPNFYVYVENNPINLTDSTGFVIDIIADVGFIGYDLLRLAIDGRKNLRANLTALGLDVGAAFLPFVTGLGPVSRLIDDIPASTPVGHSGNPIKVGGPGGKPLNTPTTIGGRPYSGHALDRMQSNGIPPSAVENTIRTGDTAPGKYPGTTTHYDSVNNLTAVTNSQTGNVVTVHPGPPSGGAP